MLSFLKKQYRFWRGYAEALWFNYKNRQAKYDLLILDDFFPNPVSAFRYVEFSYYFKNMGKVIVQTSGQSLQLMNELRPIQHFIKAYQTAYPDYAVTPFNAFKKPFAKTGYLVFLNNAYAFLPYIEKHRLDFVFCLYPGGGFNLNNEETDRKLRAVCGSPYFKGVIVSQRVTHDYLRQNHYCREDQILHVFGVVTPMQNYTLPKSRTYFGLGKETLDICFMANKYMKGGFDKGFDVFAEVADKLKSHPHIRFHVVGPYSWEDAPLYDTRHVQYYGIKSTTELNSFFEGMDIILSPNRAFVLHGGAFDGFPTASCTEGALKGVAIFTADPLQLNTQFHDGEEIEIIGTDVVEIVSKIKYYEKNPEALRDLALSGRERVKILYSENAQLIPRTQFLKNKLLLEPEPVPHLLHPSVD
jgi:glycosyltransferase involved in cell wall biosynthesis